MKRILWIVGMMAGLFLYSCGGGETQQQQPEAAPPATEQSMEADTSAMDTTMMDSTDMEMPEDDGGEEQ
ncbi:MAG: hypothetical protein KDH97_04025 [Calditrichaeota bacterium]|nr:hypothetical protein [Calditrichota bacterium]MCB0289404.1 hypothetical protein [Calditrichota bacterium]MCB0294469.1 hypothetical protein [Calditrichota bacterium]MCB0303702.1 hypothetical protein [Calditrichota bacterium]MCB0313229.1 hypothetical protein [Calditrichota bacterium]